MYALVEPIKLRMHVINRQIKALVVEDDSDMRDLLRDVIGSIGIKVTTAKDGVEGMNSYLTDKPDIVFSNFIMPSMTGVELFRRIREMDPLIPVVLFSGRYWELNRHFDREPMKPDHIMQKPVKLEKICQILYECFPQLKPPA